MQINTDKSYCLRYSMGNGNAWFQKKTRTYIFTQPLCLVGSSSYVSVANSHIIYGPYIRCQVGQKSNIVRLKCFHWSSKSSCMGSMAVLLGEPYQNCHSVIWKTICGNMVTSADRDGQFDNKLWPEHQSISCNEHLLLRYFVSEKTETQIYPKKLIMPQIAILKLPSLNSIELPSCYIFTNPCVEIVMIKVRDACPLHNWWILEENGVTVGRTDRPVDSRT